MGAPSAGTALKIRKEPKMANIQPSSFEKLINDNLPTGCHAPKGIELFGYQNAYQHGDKKEIAYEMVIRLDEACFQKLSKHLSELKSQDKLVLGNKKPQPAILNI
jgi:hypothetical protein